MALRHVFRWWCWLLLPCSAVAEFSWTAGPFGDCCSTTQYKYRLVQCSNFLTGAVVNDSFCDHAEKPCESQPCSCSSIHCAADSGTCHKDVAIRTCTGASLTATLLGCLQEEAAPTQSQNIYNLDCMQCSGTELCMDGFPLYRNTSAPSAEDCVEFCIKKGLDIAGYLHQRGECRCAASVLNEGAYMLSPERHVAGCHRFPVERLASFDAANCPIKVYRYSGHMEAGSVPDELVNILEQDINYMNKVVVGMPVVAGERPSEYAPSFEEPGMSDGTPGYQRNCWPNSCGPGAGPWSERTVSKPDSQSASYQEYVLLRYAFEANVDSARKEVFRAAADRWRQRTCINFVEQGSISDRTSIDVTVGIYDTSSCWVSGLGNQKRWASNAVSQVNLGWCNRMIYLGSVVHEIGHVVGMNHEQKRPDGAAAYFGHGPHLTMLWNNIGSRWVPQWTPEGSSYTGSADDGAGDPHVGYAAYDYASIMHYGVTDEAELPSGVTTGNRHELSEGDIRQIHDMYQCKASSVTYPTPTPTPNPTWGPTTSTTQTPAVPGACVNTDGGAVDSYGDNCADYVGNSWWCGRFDTPTFHSRSMCCECGGGVSGTPTPTFTPTPAPTQAGQPGAPTCPWQEGNTFSDDVLECADGLLCIGWSCCLDHGGRAKCPPNYPQMCEVSTCGGGTQHCCSSDCSELGGERRCLVQTPVPTPAPTIPVTVACPWLNNTGRPGQLGCADGTTCDAALMGYDCCGSMGGRARCPSNLPQMCNRATCGHLGLEHCCAQDCSPYGGVRECTASEAAIVSTSIASVEGFSTDAADTAASTTLTSDSEASTTGPDEVLLSRAGLRFVPGSLCALILLIMMEQR